MIFDNTCGFFKRLKIDRITFGRLIEMTFPSFEWPILATQNTNMYRFVYLFIWLGLFLLEVENQAFRLWGKHSNYQTAYQRMKSWLIREADPGISEMGEGGGPGAVQFLRSWDCFDSPSHTCIPFFCRKIKE